VGGSTTPPPTAIIGMRRKNFKNIFFMPIFLHICIEKN